MITEKPAYSKRKNSPSIASFFKTPSSIRINFYIGLVLIALAVAGIGFVTAADRFSTNGAGIFWLLWLGAGVYLTVDSYRQFIEQHRIGIYASDNNLIAISDHRTTDYPGAFFRGSDSRIVNAVRTPAEFYMETGNFQLIQASGRDRRLQYGYARMKLPRQLPHLLLLSPDSQPPLHGVIDKGQKLSLEGDFDKYFTLYAPRKYETDALYIFTPDIMALFIDRACNYTCEIIDDELYLYSSRPFDMINPDVIASKFKILQQIAPKFYRQTDYYADEQVDSRSANVIATPGRRLKGRLLSVFIATFMTAIFTAIAISVASYIVK